MTERIVYLDNAATTYPKPPGLLLAMVSTAPAIVNAIRDACGAMVFELPATPERVKAALAVAAAAPVREPAAAAT